MEEHKSIAKQTIVVILAAGKGTRMGRRDMAKVCFKIGSVPAVNRTISTFKRLRFERFLVVVGDKAEQVMATIAKEHPDVMYVYQRQQLGTGHAARMTAESLEQIGYEGNILVTMGDKFIAGRAIELLAAGFIKQQADMALLTVPKTKATTDSSGRVFLGKDGQAIGIIETIDLARQRIVDEIKDMPTKGAPLIGRDILRIINKHISNPKKQVVAVQELLALSKKSEAIAGSTLEKLLASRKYNLEIEGSRYTARQVERICKGVNPSLYLFSSTAFYQGVGMLENDNAQAEYYLTDVVKHLAGVKDSEGNRKFRIRAVPAKSADWIQGFNSPDELLSIQDYIRRKKRTADSRITELSKPRLKKNQYCTVRQWLDKIERRQPGLRKWNTRIYGQHEELHAEKCRDMIKVLGCYGRCFGFDEKVCIVRAPGRLNLMGRHIDHRGGFNNFLAIDRETIAVAGLRSDNNVVAVNTQPGKFKQVRFNISELIGRFAWSDWINFINSQWVRNMLHSTAGDWGNYIKATMLRLQHKYQDVKINGVNIAICGNVPIAAGLSSSSTLVVATLQAAIALNNFELTSQQFIDLCGEGEWFVGSRGGAGDHAAIYLGQRGKIANVAYLPFRVEKIIEAPKNYRVVIANSHIKAAKSAAARHMFNAKVASYNLGLALLKQRCRQITESVEYVRDINPGKIGCPTSGIYRMLLKVPEYMSRNDFKNMLSKEYRDMMESNFATHTEPAYYNVRGVLLFGAAETVRSKMCVDFLEAGRIEEFGNLMNISHNGDRVSSPGPNGKYSITQSGSTDEYLNKLINDLASEDPARVLNAQLYMQPGSYRCSTQQVDRMVDIACSVPGVAGAQIAGAGLGGCIMIMVQKDSLDALGRALTKNYYRPDKLKPAILPCIVTEGAGLAEF